MFENVLSKEAIEVADAISPLLKDFYLAGGTGLAIQLGHRVSLDLDFFSHLKTISKSSKRGFYCKEDFEMLYQKTDEVSKMIQGFMNYLTNSPTP